MFVVCCLVFVFLLRVLFFSCGLFAFGYFVVRRSCLVFAPFVDLILVTGFFWQPLTVFGSSGSRVVSLSRIMYL